MSGQKQAIYREIVLVLGVFIFLITGAGFMAHHIWSGLQQSEPASWERQLTREIEQFIGEITDTAKDKKQPVAAPAEKEKPAIPAGNKVQVNSVRFFESGRDMPTVSQRSYVTKFMHQYTRYVNAEIAYKNPMYTIKDPEIKVKLEYLFPDGNRQEVRQVARPKKEWAAARIATGMGWKDPGRWPAGIYKVRVYLDDEFTGEYQFEIE